MQLKVSFRSDSVGVFVREFHIYGNFSFLPLGLTVEGDNIALAHDELCGVVAQCDNSKHGNRGEDSFRAWCLHIGITKASAYRLLQVSALLADRSPRQQAILESLPPTLLYAVAKPSAPPELRCV